MYFTQLRQFWPDDPLLCRVTLQDVIRRIVSLTIASLSISLCFSLAAAAQNVPASEGVKLVRLDKIEIRGTRLPIDSIIRLSSLTIGQHVNDAIVNAACHKITSTGLVKSIDYGYDSYPDREGVVLTLTLVDEGPLFPSKIEPEKEESHLWQLLQSEDPLFTRDLPRTERALNYYSANIERCLKAEGREDEYASPIVVGDANGNPSEIVFRIAHYKQVRR